jgi:hypothetical protein
VAAIALSQVASSNFRKAPSGRCQPTAGVFFAAHQIVTIALTNREPVGRVSEQASVMSSELNNEPGHDVSGSEWQRPQSRQNR